MSKNNGKMNYRRPANGRNRPSRPERYIRVRSVRREPFDPRPLGRAAIAQALADAQDDATIASDEAKHQDATGNDAADGMGQEADHDA
ncbi:hypothetical protein [Nocardia arizonensis]|uniref:hypothetical protein n=1 Tax=Nocardia arizonensis TaxID=1141647 RepID=UPI000B10B370|nr:hypothetical protein [Nocardia arizonensis]